MSRAWGALAGMLMLGLPLGWWLMVFGRRGRHATTLTTAVALGVYVPALVAAPLLKQPRVRGRALPAAAALLLPLALAIRLLALREFRRRGTTLAPAGWVPPTLVRTGVYRVVRHPMYLSDCLLYGGWCCLWRGLYGLFLLGPLFALAAWWRARLEERYLLEPAFGEEFRQYRRRTGMLLPRLARERT